MHSSIKIYRIGLSPSLILVPYDIFLQQIRTSYQYYLNNRISQELSDIYLVVNCFLKGCGFLFLLECSNSIRPNDSLFKFIFNLNQSIRILGTFFFHICSPFLFLFLSRMFCKQKTYVRFTYKKVDLEWSPFCKIPESIMLKFVIKLSLIFIVLYFLFLLKESKENAS